jgi:hypothetical protein
MDRSSVTLAVPLLASALIHHRTNVDLTFTCNPASHVAFEDRAVVKLSSHVTRKAVIGSFGCPERRDDVDFPPTRRQP